MKSLPANAARQLASSSAVAGLPMKLPVPLLLLLLPPPPGAAGITTAAWAGAPLVGSCLFVLRRRTAVADAADTQ